MRFTIEQRHLTDDGGRPVTGDAVSFFLYHSESDVKHFQRLDQAIAAGILTDKLVADIVRCAKVTARLYALQLEEIGHF